MLCVGTSAFASSNFNVVGVVQDAAEKVTLAAERQRQVVSQLNPLNLPSVQALLGKR